MESYGPKAKYFFPEASGADDTIVVVIEAINDYADMFQASYAYNNNGAGLNFDEKYIGGAHAGKKHWYSSLPSFLIGASLKGILDPDHASPPNKDITAELHLERGMRIVNAFSVDSAREEWHTHPSAHHPPGVYNPPSKSGDPPEYFPNNDKDAKYV